MLSQSQRIILEMRDVVLVRKAASGFISWDFILIVWAGAS